MEYQTRNGEKPSKSSCLTSNNVHFQILCTILVTVNFCMFPFSLFFLERFSCLSEKQLMRGWSGRGMFLPLQFYQTFHSFLAHQHNRIKGIKKKNYFLRGLFFSVWRFGNFSKMSQFKVLIISDFREINAEKKTQKRFHQ